MSLKRFSIFCAGFLVMAFLSSFTRGNAVVTTIINSPTVYTEKIKTDTLIKDCPQGEQIEKIITEAISIGAPVYNSGYHLACYRIYEWAGYKILYEYGSSCKDIEKVLKTAIEKSHGDYSDLEKAWIMRVAFDTIMGVPTQTSGPEKKAGICNQFSF